MESINVSEVFQAIYDSKINVTLTWFLNGGFYFIIGDTSNGIRAKGLLWDFGEGVEWMIAQVAKRSSEFLETAKAKGWIE